MEVNFIACVVISRNLINFGQAKHFEIWLFKAFLSQMYIFTLNIFSKFNISFIYFNFQRVFAVVALHPHRPHLPHLLLKNLLRLALWYVFQYAYLVQNHLARAVRIAHVVQESGGPVTLHAEFQRLPLQGPSKDLTQLLRRLQDRAIHRVFHSNSDYGQFYQLHQFYHTDQLSWTTLLEDLLYSQVSKMLQIGNGDRLYF